MVTGPGTVVFDEDGNLVVTPTDDAKAGDTITVVITDKDNRAEFTIEVVEPAIPDLGQSEIIIDGIKVPILDGNGEITVKEGEDIVISNPGGTFDPGDIVIRDKEGNPLSEDFEITEKDGTIVITPTGPGLSDDFVIEFKDDKGNEYNVDVIVEKDPTKQSDQEDLTGSSAIAESTGSSEADLKCLAVTAGTVGAPLLLLLPLAVASQIKIPGLGAVQAQLNAEMARMNDELQRGLGIANDSVRRLVQQFNGAVAVDNRALGQVGGAIAGVTAVAALLGISAAIYTTCKAAEGDFNVADMSSTDATANGKGGSAAGSATTEQAGN